MTNAPLRVDVEYEYVADDYCVVVVAVVDLDDGVVVDLLTMSDCYRCHRYHSIRYCYYYYSLQ